MESGATRGRPIRSEAEAEAGLASRQSFDQRQLGGGLLEPVSQSLREPRQVRQADGVATGHGGAARNDGSNRMCSATPAAGAAGTNGAGQ